MFDWCVISSVLTGTLTDSKNQKIIPFVVIVLGATFSSVQKF